MIRTADLRMARVLFALTFIGCSSKQPPALFSRPEAAVVALEETIASKDPERANKLFGDEGDYLLYSGDPVLDQNRAEEFVSLFKQRHELREVDAGAKILLIGNKGWPFPVPLMEEDGDWFFDAEAGRNQILARRIGQNELTTIDVARKIALAQRVYASHDWDGDGRYQYAARLISSPGLRDGLYWPVEGREKESPLGSVIAKAADEDYVITPGGAPQPYHGYFYKVILHEPAAVDLDDPFARFGRYWLISYPAEWGVTGIMSFAANERGWIYEKDLGKEFEYSQEDLEVDSSWTRIE